MLGKGYLCAVVTQDAANWPTPDASNHRDGDVLRKDNNLEQGGFHGVSLHHAMTKYGQAAPANPNTHGSRQESLDQSQRNWQTFAHGTHNRGETPHRQVVKALVNGDKAKTQCLTVNQVFAEEIKGTNRQEAWATPNAFCYQPPENMEQWTKRAEYQQTEKGVNLHKPIRTQVLHEVEKMWRTPSVAEEKNQNTSTQIYLQNQVGATPKAWATPRAEMDSGAHRGKPDTLHSQIKTQASGKLNPRWVETLMGLPVGWTMASCASPVTIVQTSCGCLGTELSPLPQNERSEC
jgi:hypothetical protein